MFQPSIYCFIYVILKSKYETRDPNPPTRGVYVTLVGPERYGGEGQVVSVNTKPEPPNF